MWASSHLPKQVTTRELRVLVLLNRYGNGALVGARAQWCILELGGALVRADFVAAADFPAGAPAPAGACPAPPDRVRRRRPAKDSPSLRTKAVR